MIPPLATGHLDGSARVFATDGQGIVAMLRRRRRLLVTVALLVTGFVTLLVVLMPSAYEAESRLMVRIGREYSYRPEVAGLQPPRAPGLAEIVNSEVEILSSRELAEQVVTAVGMKDLYPDLAEDDSDPAHAVEVAVLNLRGAMSIRPVLESGVIRVGFEHPSPEVAARTVNLLVDRFSDKHLAVFGERGFETLQLQMAQRQEKLATTERNVAAFKAENAVYDLDEQRRLRISHLLALDDELRGAEIELAEVRLVTASMNELQLPVDLPPHLSPGMLDGLMRQRVEVEGELSRLTDEIPDQLLRDASVRLLDLELEESVLRRDYSESSRKVRSVRDEIERVRKFIAASEQKAGAHDEAEHANFEAKASGLRSAVAVLDGEIELLAREERERPLVEAAAKQRALEVRCAELRRRRAELDPELRNLNAQEITLLQLERERTAALAAYEQCRTRLEDAQLAEEFDRDRQISVRVIDKAVPPVQASGLSLGLKLALGVFVGLLAGVGAAMLAELLRAR